TLADLAYKQAKNTFVLPGIGKLVLVERPSRKMIMRFGEKAGQEITIPKKKLKQTTFVFAAIRVRENYLLPGTPRASRASLSDQTAHPDNEIITFCRLP